jgi:hypothetical protein
MSFHAARDLTAATAIVTVKIHRHAYSQATYKARLCKQIIDTPFNRDKDFAEFTGCPCNTNASKFTGGLTRNIGVV